MLTTLSNNALVLQLQKFCNWRSQMLSWGVIHTPSDPLTNSKFSIPVPNILQTNHWIIS